MAELKLDPSLLDRLAALPGGAIETKEYDPDQPRADNGQWGSGGGGSRAAAGGQGGADGGDDDEDDDDGGDGDEVGKGYEPADQARHDAAATELIGSVSRLHIAMDQGSAVFHDPASTAAQIVGAAEQIGKHYDAAASALDTMNAVRDEYGDPPEDVPVVNENYDLRDAIDSFTGALSTLRSETSDRAQAASRIASEQARGSDPVDELQRELEAALGRGSKSRPALSGLTHAVAALSETVARGSDRT